MSMRYEAFNPNFHIDQAESRSKLRSWFRRQVDGNNFNCKDETVALGFKSEIQNFLQKSLHLDVDNQTEILPSSGPHGIRFLGTLVKRNVIESPAVRAVHKLKEKVKLFTLQRQEAWDAGTVRIGKKWLAHGLKKVKESEIKHMADSSSVLSQISCFC
ncbi:hypothetical protein L1049_020095 [Liquidambar formosana]|uniref:Uncharacterized protein n=1 Tax=Liquidambar formosana TaxID=63359 RepID=A0AAP0X5R1_LIQFO